MKIYSTRHGLTDYNAREIILGTTDMPLNDEGITQAEELANRILYSEDIDIGTIVSSPMQRALKTAEIISRINGGIPVFTDSRLSEWNYGEYEGRPRTSEGFSEGKLQFAFNMGNTGESLLKLAHRVYSLLDEIIDRRPGKNILVVSHGGICRIIETYFNSMTTEEFSGWFMENCQLLEYEVDPKSVYAFRFGG